MFTALALYFLLTASLLALVLFPGLRARAWGQVKRIVSHGRSTSHDLAQRSRHGLVQTQGRMASGASGAFGAVRWVGRHWPWALAAVTILALPVLVAVGLRGMAWLDGYDHTQSRPVNPQVAALLQGEQLVAPPPLPPELFTARDLEMARPLIDQASREWALFDADFRQRLLVVFKLMRERHGIDMALLEGYRSPERQARLAALGDHVTRAGAMQSYHQYGLAADCAFLRNGRIVIDERDPWAERAYALYGETAESVGLTWGGRWRSIRDFGHVELTRPGVLGTPASVGDAARRASAP